MIANPGDICLCGHERAMHPSDGACSSMEHGSGDCLAFKGLHCHDCPDLGEGAPRRDRCCRDVHLDRRRAGDAREWLGIDTARQIEADEAALDVDSSRQVKRAKARRKGKPEQ